MKGGIGVRTFLGILASVLAALAVQAGVVYLASAFVDMPAVTSVAREEVANAVASASATAHLVTLLSYFLAGLAAAWIGIAVGRQEWVGWTGAAAIALVGLILAFLFPDPAWAQFGAPIAALVGAVIARHLAPAAPPADAAGAPADA